MFTIREILDLAIRIEKNGEDFYRDGMEKALNPELMSLFQWLTDQEGEHREWFESKKKALKTNQDDPLLEEMGSTILEDIMGDQRFSLNEADLCKIDDTEALLQLAIEFEKDTILFYEMIGSLITDIETSGHLNEIIEEENHHVELLKEFQEKGVSSLGTNELEQKDP